MSKEPAMLFYTWLALLRLFPPGFPGKARLARLVLKPHLGSRDVYVSTGQRRNLLVPGLREPIGFYLATDGVYEPDTAAFLHNYLSPGMVFVDIGANIGAFTVLAAGQVGPTGQVIAIEPSPRNFSYLKHNVQTNLLPNVLLQQCAVAAREADNVPFYEAPLEQFGMGALAPQFHTDPILVPTRSLDQILLDINVEKVDLVKVDVEGFEAAVFRGASQLLSRWDAPVILFEFCDWAEERASNIEIGDAQRILREYGYQIWRLTEYKAGIGQPLSKIVCEGTTMLLAVKSEGRG